MYNRTLICSIIIVLMNENFVYCYVLNYTLTLMQFKLAAMILNSSQLEKKLLYIRNEN